MRRALAAALVLVASPRAQDVDRIVEAARAELAPDSRTAIFDVEPEVQGERLVLRGTVHDASMAAALVRFVDERSDLEVVDELRRLPDAALGHRTHALVSVSVANLRAEPRHGAELATQVLLGTPLRVLERDRGWLRVQAPNGYLGWTDDRIALKTGDERDAWFARRLLVVIDTFAVVRSEPRPDCDPVSDAVAGCLLAIEAEQDSYWRVAYPDGRSGYLEKHVARPWGEWLAGARATPETITTTARRFLGVPYLWGGTSTKGMDCSGFTSTVYFLNGLVLPRDASQQVLVGEEVDVDELRAGDLLFFGRRTEERERVTHVGISLGGRRFIHCAGDVRIESLDPEDADFNPSRLRSLLRAKRVLGAADVMRLAESPAYARQPK